jgi:hypothetical protein
VNVDITVYKSVAATPECKKKYSLEAVKSNEFVKIRTV